jgi:hypothetical protein
MMQHLIIEEDGKTIIADTNSNFRIIKVDESTFKMQVSTWNSPWKTKIYSLPGLLPEMINETPKLSLNNDTLSLSGNNKVYLGNYKQKLSISNDTIYLTSGGSVFIGESNTSQIQNVSLGTAFGVSDPYPNPTSSLLNVEYALPSNQNSGYVSIFDIKGVEIRKIKVDNSSKNIRFDLSNLNSGSYNIQLRTDSGYSSCKKVIVID